MLNHDPYAQEAPYINITQQKIIAQRVPEPRVISGPPRSGG